ncbi:MAG: protein kinase [Acidobacteria bacterium]|nr:protein kinase [Acidobacteriota bacterium]
MALPDKLGRYRVEKLVGKGAMGTVYRGYDPRIDRTVALKTFTIQALDPDDQQNLIQRFHQEAQLAGKLSHPNIVTIFDVGEDFIAMEFLEGGSLQDLLKSKGKLPFHEVSRILNETASALDHAHAKQIVHRDIKPANILLVGPNQQVKLTDFGIAKLIDGKMTATGLVLGTPYYMSPEQVMGKRVDYLSDLFSLAVVTYEMITGVAPFPGETITTVAYKIVHEPPPPLAPTPISAQLDKVLARALAKDPANRFENASAFAQAFQAALSAGGSDALTATEVMPAPAMDSQTPASRPRSRFSPWWLAIPVLVAFLLIAAFFFSKKQPPPDPQSLSSQASVLEPAQQDDGSMDLELPTEQLEVPSTDDAVSEQISESNAEQPHSALAPVTVENPPSAPPQTSKKTEMPPAEKQPQPTTKSKASNPTPTPKPPVVPSHFSGVLDDDMGKLNHMVKHGNALYLADTSSESIRIWDFSKKSIVREIELPDEPGAICVDTHQNIYVADPGDNTIRRFKIDGNADLTFGKKGALDLDLDGCLGVTLDDKGLIWIADTDNNRILGLNSKFAVVTEIADVKKPSRIQFDPSGVLWAIQPSEHRLIAFDRKGKQLWTLGSEGKQNGQFDEPQDMAFMDGFLLVADFGNDRVQVFDRSSRKWFMNLQADELKQPTCLVMLQDRLLVGNRKGTVIAFSN